MGVFYRYKQSTVGIEWPLWKSNYAPSVFLKCFSGKADGVLLCMKEGVSGKVGRCLVGNINQYGA